MPSVPLTRMFRLMRSWHTNRLAPASVIICLAILMALGVFTALLLPLGQPVARGAATTTPWPGTTNAPEVHVAVDLQNPELHPRQLVYDTRRDGLWFWTSTQSEGTTFDNHVYFYDRAKSTLRSWPIYDGDWSAQVLGGLAVAPDGQVWIGWTNNLVAFSPDTGQFTRYALPAEPQYPLPKEAMGTLPPNLGIADLAIAADGTIWLARSGALSLTSFSPSTQTFQEHPLPANAGDPAKLAIGPEGHLYFTTNLSADHPGFGAEKIGEFAPENGGATIMPQAALALTITPQGGLYSAGGQGFGLAYLAASEHASALAQRRAPVFQQRAVSFSVDGAMVATDTRGRVWMAVGGQPQVAVLDSASGQVRTYQYEAASVVAHPPARLPLGMPTRTVAPNAVWLTHIVAMATDRQGHLWYIRAGSDRIEEVAA